MKNPIISLTICIAAVLVMCGCGADKGKDLTSMKKKRVNVQPVVLCDLSEKLNLTGEVMPFASVTLTSKVPGRLEHLAITNEHGKYIPITEGTHIKKGQQLAVIDYSTYMAKEQRAEAAKVSAKAQFDDALREEKRMTALFDEGASTERARDQSITARARCEAALKQAEASLELARIDLDEATPDSFINGIVVAKFIDEGNIVAPGTAILTIQDISRVKAVFSVAERYLSRIIPGTTRVDIASDAVNGGPFTAVVSKVYPSVDPATRTGTAEILLDNADGRLRTGIFVKLLVEMDKAENAPIIPLSAVIRQGQETFVFVVEASTAHRRSVQLGLTEKERVQVKEGLREGELLVVQGQRDLQDGDEVATQERGRQ